jgi:hypothetical protein
MPSPSSWPSSPWTSTTSTASSGHWTCARCALSSRACHRRGRMGRSRTRPCRHRVPRPRALPRCVHAPCCLRRRLSHAFCLDLGCRLPPRRPRWCWYAAGAGARPLPRRRPGLPQHHHKRMGGLLVTTDHYGGAYAAPRAPSATPSAGAPHHQIIMPLSIVHPSRPRWTGAAVAS